MGKPPLSRFHSTRSEQAVVTGPVLSAPGRSARWSPASTRAKPPFFGPAKNHFVCCNEGEQKNRKGYPWPSFSAFFETAVTGFLQPGNRLRRPAAGQIPLTPKTAIHAHRIPIPLQRGLFRGNSQLGGRRRQFHYVSCIALGGGPPNQCQRHQHICLVRRIPQRHLRIPRRPVQAQKSTAAFGGYQPGRWHRRRLAAAADP